jgi:uncharacterized protein (DUF1697 family)
MSDLCLLLESLGYRDVATLLNSGNVVFTAPANLKADPATRIEAALLAEWGLVSRVTVLTSAELAKIVEGNPLLDVARDYSRLLVALLAKDVDRKRLRRIAEQDWSPGALAIVRRAAYLWCPDGILASPLATEMGKMLRDDVTTRNWTTVLKVHEAAGRA